VEIKKRQSGESVILDIEGNIDLHSSPEVRRFILDALRDCGPRLLLNLTGVRYIDSSGVASLVEGLKLARDRNRTLVLFGLSTLARQVLELSRLTRFFEIYADEAAALAGAPPAGGQAR